jgi:hypothetical protein
MDGVVDREAALEQFGDPAGRIIVDPDEPTIGILEAGMMEECEMIEPQLCAGGLEGGPELL